MEILAFLVDPHEVLGERRGNGPREHRLGRGQGPGIRGRLFAFAALRFAKVPMIRQFGLLLAVGIAAGVAFLLGLLARRR